MERLPHGAPGYAMPALINWLFRRLWRPPAEIVEEEQRTTPPEELWPAVAAAFQFVGSSYEQMLRRIEARENGIRAMMTIATAITFPVLTLLTGPNSAVRKDFGSPWFLIGIGALAMLMLLGILSSAFEVIQVVDPARLYNEMLTFTEWEFKKNALYLSGLDFAANARTLNRLGILASVMAVLLFIEVACLVAWGLDVPPQLPQQLLKQLLGS